MECYMTWEQEIQLAREDEREKERERSQKIIAEKDRKIAELEAQLAKLQK